MSRTSAVHSLERLQALIRIAEELGYLVRHENLGGMGGGLCQFRGQKWLFIDLAVSTADNLAGLESSLADAATAGRAATPGRTGTRSKSTPGARRGTEERVGPPATLRRSDETR